MTDKICFKIGVENGWLLYDTKKFESFEELIKYVKGMINKYGHDMFLCNLIVQAFKDNSFDFENACFMQETIPFRYLKVETVEQMIGDLVKKNWEEQ